jgi:hypothetical protein
MSYKDGGRLREDTLKAKCTYKYILTGINKEGLLKRTPADPGPILTAKNKSIFRARDPSSG